MAKLAVEAAILNPCPCVLIERGGVERFGHVIESRCGELVSVGIKEASCLCGKTLDGEALVLDRTAQRGGLGPLREQVGLCVLQGVACREQRVDIAPLRPDELVDGPRGNGRLAQLRDRGRLVTPSLPTQLLGQRIALVGELVEWEAVEVVGLDRSDRSS